MNVLRLTGSHTAVPRHVATEPYQSGVVKYRLNDVEKAFARAGRLDLIPTGEDRGLTAPPPPPRESKKPRKLPEKRRTNKEIIQSITSEMLIADMKAGLTNRAIALKYGFSTSTVSTLLVKFGLANPKGIQRQHRKNSRPVVNGRR